MPNHDLRELVHLDRDIVRRLAAAGVVSAEVLLAAAGRSEDRRHLAETAGVPFAVVTQLAQLVELTRVLGIRLRDTTLLRSAGVRTLAELQDADARALADRLLEANEPRRLTRLVPPVPIIAGWIAEARRLESIVVEDGTGECVSP